MQTRCKFECTGVTKQKGWGEHKFIWSAELTAVVSGSEENKEFFAATPTGSLRLATIRNEVFEPGRFYYIDISEAV